jgi:hypothetical protein
MVLLPPPTVKDTENSSVPLDPSALIHIEAKFGFQHRSLTIMLILAV